MKGKFFCVVLIALQTSQGVSAQTDSSGCFTELLTSYGLEGLAKPEPIVLEMCPNVLSSCCSKRDQLQMYSNWANSGERREIKKHFLRINKIYTDLIDKLEKVYEFAEDISQKLKMKKISNCKEISKRLLTFEIVELQERIEENFRTYEEFFVDSYKGFYCSLCDYENHKFFNNEEKVVIYSEKFCRDIVENTLPALMFLYKDSIKYLNLVSKFLLSCDHKGDYMADVPIPKSLIFVPEEDVQAELTRCKNERNSQNWFVNCLQICERFKIATFEDFFEPELVRVKEFTKFIEDQIHHIKIEEANFNAQNQSRILETKKTNLPVFDLGLDQKNTRMLTVVDDSEVEQVKENKLKEGIVFKRGLESKVKLELFKAKILTDGLSFHDVGKSSLLNSSVFIQVKALQQLQKDSYTSGQTKTEAPIDLKTDTTTENRMLMNAALKWGAVLRAGLLLLSSMLII